jgi:hypothetical protein
MLLFAPLLHVHFGDDRALLDALDASPALLPGFDLSLLFSMLQWSVRVHVRVRVRVRVRVHTRMCAHGLTD